MTSKGRVLAALGSRKPDRVPIRDLAAAGLLADYRGRAVHDFWKSYFDYGCEHALCNARLLGELVFLWEVQAQAWAKEMIDHLLGIKEAVATASAAGLAYEASVDLAADFRPERDVGDALAQRQRRPFVVVL